MFRQINFFFHFFIDDEGTVWLSSTEKGVYHVYFPKKQFRTLCLACNK